MAIGDIKILRGSLNAIPSKTFAVAAGTTASILPGTPVAKALGTAGNVVSAATDGTPVVGTNFYAGFATSTSTETATAAGTVDVLQLIPGVVYRAAPKATIASQTAYNALVGSRVVLDLTAGVWTVDAAAADSANNGIVIEPLNVTDFPNTVAFSVRQGVSYNS